jgi:hypothetical protein
MNNALNKKFMKSIVEQKKATNQAERKTLFKNFALFLG